MHYEFGYHALGVQLRFLSFSQGSEIKDCNGPLGLTNGRIRDDQLSASSSFDSDSTGPQHARRALPLAKRTRDNLRENRI
ncbi:hypothetical protein ANCDUO_21653 [Ancylostoma duodenale]|uniref:Uncharacterized protein n=1 Tax=Ancylostoma duodenale TaxID=51022 RepID=A0A0C2FNH0_9BILA|nr:hypothetical protein ANCDUO_21653 [Ancylostoma duodenale]